MPWPVRTEAERFFDAVAIGKADECWLWMRYVNPKTGYGDFRTAEKKTVRAHRYSFFLAGKTLKDGEEVRHTCHVRHCVNPAHLIPGTRKQNMQDCVAANRHAYGERNGQTKYSSKVVDQVFVMKAAGKTQAAIAKHFGMHQSNVSCMLNGLSRKRG